MLRKCLLARVTVNIKFSCLTCCSAFIKVPPLTTFDLCHLWPVAVGLLKFFLEWSFLGAICPLLLTQIITSGIFPLSAHRNETEYPIWELNPLLWFVYSSIHSSLNCSFNQWMYNPGVGWDYKLWHHSLFQSQSWLVCTVVMIYGLLSGNILISQEDI